MKKVVIALAVFAAIPSAFAADFQLERLDAASVCVKADAPVPAPQPEPAQVPQDVVNRFQQAYNELNTIRTNLTWVRSDLDRLESRARQISQINYHDAFFENDLRRMSMDMSNRFFAMQQAARDVQNLLTLAQKDAGLNKQARDIDVMAREILRETWPGIEDAAGRLEWTVRAAKPEVIGYNSQWTAMDISRNARQFADQARWTSDYTRQLIDKTQP
ncbi:MAG: hypothetical protein HY952_09320 [Elusimicrobia bacterium]|nr:hypothetical protein [Elusimicrobiota bacterium]